jgi:hypothetical protein
LQQKISQQQISVIAATAAAFVTANLGNSSYNSSFAGAKHPPNITPRTVYQTHMAPEFVS